MDSPKITRPEFPKGYVDKPASYLTWAWVAEQLTEAKHYWLASVRSNGRPHGVFPPSILSVQSILSIAVHTVHQSFSLATQPLPPHTLSPKGPS